MKCVDYRFKAVPRHKLHQVHGIETVRLGDFQYGECLQLDPDGLVEEGEYHHTGGAANQTHLKAFTSQREKSAVAGSR